MENAHTIPTAEAIVWAGCQGRQSVIAGVEKNLLFFPQVFLSAPSPFFLFTWHFGPLVERGTGFAVSEISLR